MKRLIFVALGGTLLTLLGAGDITAFDLKGSIGTERQVQEAPTAPRDAKESQKLVIGESSLKTKLTVPSLLKDKFHVLKDFHPVSTKCAPHHLYLHQDYKDTLCFGFVQPDNVQVNTSGDSPKTVTGGYTCRFMYNFPPDDACPAGSQLQRLSSLLYQCTSQNPIPPNQASCIANFEVGLHWTNQTGHSDPLMHNGFSCHHVDDVYGDGVPYGVCTDKDAHFIGWGVPDYCCVYLAD